jgi:hypothetical protein
MFYSNLKYKTAGAVYSGLSDDKISAWGIVIEKTWAKVLGNYFKVSDGSTSTFFRALTGLPVFIISITHNFDPVAAFSTLTTAEQVNYMIIKTSAGTDTTLNVCNLCFSHAYTLLFTFSFLYKTLASTNAIYNQRMIMVRNP